MFWLITIAAQDQNVRLDKMAVTPLIPVLTVEGRGAKYMSSKMSSSGGGPGRLWRINRDPLSLAAVGAKVDISALSRRRGGAIQAIAMTNSSQA